MTLLKVKKTRFPFQGKTLEGGAEVDSRTWPHVDSRKWAQLIDHGYFELVDQPGRDLSRAIAERDRARDTIARTAETEVAFTEHGAVDAPVVESPIKVSTHVCPDCAHVAKSEHGLKVHRGRKHKE